MLKTLLIQNVFSKADPMQIALFYIGQNMLHTKSLNFKFQIIIYINQYI